MTNPVFALNACATVPVVDVVGDLRWGAEHLVLTEHAFRVDVAEQEQRLSHAHTAMRWVPYETARDLLAWDSKRTAAWEVVVRDSHGWLRTSPRPTDWSRLLPRRDRAGTLHLVRGNDRSRARTRDQRQGFCSVCRQSLPWQRADGRGCRCGCPLEGVGTPVSGHPRVHPRANSVVTPMRVPGSALADKARRRGCWSPGNSLAHPRPAPKGWDTDQSRDGAEAPRTSPGPAHPARSRARRGEQRRPGRGRPRGPAARRGDPGGTAGPVPRTGRAGQGADVARVETCLHRSVARRHFHQGREVVLRADVDARGHLATPADRPRWNL